MGAPPPPLVRVVLDFETYYDKDYSLRKMTPVEYVLDPRFEIIGCAVKFLTPQGNNKAYWLDGPQLPEFFAGLDPNNTAIITHNALFDMCIVVWRLGFTPRVMIDTMGVARAKLGHVLKSVSLKAVALHLGLGAKGDAIGNAIGKTGAMIRADPWFYKQYVAYGINDAELCAGIYEKLVVQGSFPTSEISIMDMVIRATVLPQFILDRHVLAEHAHAVKQEKDLLLTQAMLTTGVSSKADLMSNERFAGLLRGLGVDPPMKVSPLTGKPTYAFAKTDVDFIELEEHDDPRVQTLVAARAGFKSTLEETRTERLTQISNLTWPPCPVTPGGNQGAPGQYSLMPLPLRYGGAHTHRLSGDWKLNVQNLPRGGRLRRALIAPPGHVVLAVDASQIEARIVAWICGQWDLVELFANKADVYSKFATRVFGFEVNKKEHPTERFVGKQAVLGLGYGLGWVKFQVRLQSDSHNQTGAMITLSDEEAQRVVTIYRDTNPAIPLAWRMLNYTGIPVLARGGHFEFGPVRFGHQAGGGVIYLPNGLELFYHELHLKEDGTGDREWWFTYGGKPKKLYGGKLLENIVQALARIIVMDAAIRIRRKLKRFDLQVHDELVYVLRQEVADEALALVLDEMSVRPSWAPELPLAAEAHYGPSYGDAK